LNQGQFGEFHDVLLEVIILFALIFDLKKLMLFPNSKSSLVHRLPAKTAEKVGKIRNILSLALGEVHDETLRLKKSESNSPSKRKSDESSES
jgi:hypothetical protein